MFDDEDVQIYSYKSLEMFTEKDLYRLKTTLDDLRHLRACYESVITSLNELSINRDNIVILTWSMFNECNYTVNQIQDLIEKIKKRIWELEKK